MGRELSNVGCWGLTGSEGDFLGEEGRRGCEEAKVKRKWNKALTKLGIVKTYYCDVNLEMKVWDRWEGTHCKGFFE